MDISCPFAKTLLSILLTLKPHQLLRYLSKASHLVQFSFTYNPKLKCCRNCCRALTCGDEPRVEVEFSLADLILMCLADNLRREFDCFAKHGPIAVPFAEEIASAVESDEPKEAGEWVALTALNAELDRTFWQGFPWCCTRVAKRRKMVAQMRDRVKTKLNPTTLKPMSRVWSIPKLHEFLHDDDASGFPAFNGPDYDWSRRATRSETKGCCDFMCCSGLYTYWPWAKMCTFLVLLFMGVGIPLLVFLTTPTVVEDLGEMPNTVYFVLSILSAAVITAILLVLTIYHCFWAVKTARRWKRFRLLQQETYLPRITTLRSEAVQAPQREHRQEIGKAFHENYVPTGEEKVENLLA